MNRREFLKRLGALGLVAATPKVIIDLAANTWRQPSYILTEIQSSADFAEVFEAIVSKLMAEEVYDDVVDRCIGPTYFYDPACTKQWSMTMLDIPPPLTYKITDLL